MRILLVEDREELCTILKESFLKNTIDMDVAYNGEDGLALILAQEYSVIVLDIMLPFMSGVALLGEIRKRGVLTPVLMLTALDAIDNKVEALELGADDYLVKDFEFKELLARVRALARRPQMVDLCTITVGNVTLNRNVYSAEMNGQSIALSGKEGIILEYLFQNKGKFVSKESILRTISQCDKAIEIGNVEVHIHFLRKKFPPQRAGFVIETKHRYGYRIFETGIDHV